MLLTNNDMTPTSCRLTHYHIDFTDLPVVGILTPCDKVFDYVSPWELEIGDTRPCNRKRRSGQKRRDTSRLASPGERRVRANLEWEARSGEHA